MTELLNCPFCGGEAEEDSGRCAEYGGHEHQDCSVLCKVCGAEIYISSSQDFPCSCCHDVMAEAIKRWNARSK